MIKKVTRNGQCPMTMLDEMFGEVFDDKKDRVCHINGITIVMYMEEQP